MAAPVRLSARLCWALDAKPGVLLTVDFSGAVLFVMGCVTFYVPSQFTTGVTLFLLGSVLMLVSVAGRALLRYGPSR